MICRSQFVMSPPKVALVFALLSISSCPSSSLWHHFGNNSEDNFQGQRQQQQQQQQQLDSYELIAGYQPVSLVVDQNALDQDVKAIHQLLLTGTSMGSIQAREVYYRGAFSQAVGTLTLFHELSSLIRRGTLIRGVNSAMEEVQGKLYDDRPRGSRRLYIQYDVSASQGTYVRCRVGANPYPVFDDCLVNDGMVIVDNYGHVNYTYDMTKDNGFRRTIRGLSVEAEDSMYLCSSCPYSEYNKFYQYYGDFAYADTWVLSAFDGKVTEFENGNADFRLYDAESRAEVIYKGIVGLAFWMHVVRGMDFALDNCQEGCATTNCTQDAVHSWDESRAYYAGSLEGQDGAGPGDLLYAIADTQCQNFATCGEMGREHSGTSYVNLEILKLFQDGQQMILTGQCQYAKLFKENIVTLMAVPLIQGTLYSARARTQAFPDSAEAQKLEAEGAGFVAGVLPLVHACSVADAAVIHDNMKAGYGGKPDFAAVKDAFERQYQCLGILCSDVGGILNLAKGGRYWDEAAPCTKKSIEKAEKRRNKSLSDQGATNRGGLVVLLAVAAALFMAVVVAVSTFFGPRPLVTTTSAAVMDPETTPTKMPPALC